MTFGSFIGFSFAFGLLIDDLFGDLPNPPSPALWAPWGPLLGAIVRPVGGWLADKAKSGSRITAYSTLLQLVGALFAGIAMVKTKDSSAPMDYFAMFYLSFMALFIGSGIGNGSTFRSVPFIFNKAQAGPVLGWTSAVAAYGAFIIPQVFKVAVAHGNPQNACWVFMAYYLVGLFLNWWYYDRLGSEVKC